MEPLSEVCSIGDFLSDSIVNGVNSVNPRAFANTVINSPTGNSNIRFDAKNLSATIATGFNSGIDALIYAFDYIQRGYIDRIVAGGLEEISYYSLLGLSRTGLISPSANIRPFAIDSDGIVVGEGCALFHLETEEAAKQRGAQIQAEIIGAAMVLTRMPHLVIHQMPKLLLISLKPPANKLRSVPKRSILSHPLQTETHATIRLKPQL